MRQAQALSGIIIGGAVALLTTQPVRAAATQVTGVRLNESDRELKLVLETKAGDTRPQIFTVSRGNDLVTDIVNTQLNLSQGNSFSQENPMPGITSLIVSQLDANKVRVTVTGTENPPTGKIIQSEADLITLSLSPASNNQAAVPMAVSPSPTAPATAATPDLPTQSASKQKTEAPSSPTTLAQTPTPRPVAQIQPQTSPTSTVPTLTRPDTSGTLSQTPAQLIAQAQTQPSPTPTVPTVVPPPVVTPPSPDVLVPNPKVTIDGNPAPATGAAQPVAPAPPFLPRAIAPPVGDIAISNINASAGFIDLGTAVRVPRLVLREAPVREVLALLARSAGLNVAFTGGGGQAGAPPGIPGGGGTQQTISLDLENELVQDVFNYVLQISGLQANRVGRTILVGPQLPDVARNLISRTLRLNQVPVGQAVGFLISQGAEQQQVTTQRTLTVVGEGAAAQRIENTTTSVQKITPQDVQAQPGVGQGLTGPLVLRGLAVGTNERLNAITLVGEPRKVEIATALLTQLDLRRRQVAVNVKVVDVNLLGTDAFNSSFSFGIGDSFFSNDGGAASFNYGGFRPPTGLQTSTSPVSPPVIQNPFANATIFQDPNSPLTIPGLGSRTIILSQPGQQPVQIIPPGAAQVIGGRPFITLNNPLTPGIVNVTQSGDTIVTYNADGTVTATAGQPGTVSFGLPSLFQFPKRLLSALQASITSGNAKILTDPTLVVQEGQTARVSLTQEVVGNIRSETQSTTNQTTRTVTAEIREAGLILEIAIDRIDDNGFVTLAVNPRVTAIGSQQDISVGDDRNRIALLNVRQLASGQIRLRDGQTLILSGIIQDSDRTTVRKVPILGDIPILGALFRSTERANQRQEVIVLLTPQIIQDTEGSSFGYNYTPGREANQILRR
ncbi:MAG TPA: AMIN domain-containing protein [Coleofasciculaceae cyanobacterium]